MNTNPDVSDSLTFNKHCYPAAHWAEIKKFVVGDDYDPNNNFRLADDAWGAWRYARNGMPTEAYLYRIPFGHLNSFLKPYAKWFVYRGILGKGYVTAGTKQFPNSLSVIDKLIVLRGFHSLAEIAPISVFRELWDSQLLPLSEGAKYRERSDVFYQEFTHTFWLSLSEAFGMPYEIPPVAPYYRKKTSDFAIDESKVIPPVVIQQLTNRLALHRKGIECITRYHHYRVCVLILLIILGRRFRELTTAPRGSGDNGPLCYRPTNGSQNQALWFRFNPLKNGPATEVYVSREWEDITWYCVKALLNYSDEIRHFARPEERDLFLLVSLWNRTAGGTAASGSYEEDLRVLENLSNPRRRVQERATAFGYSGFLKWLNGQKAQNLSSKSYPGIFETWNITEDGTANGKTYKFSTHYGRHTRQNTLALDQNIPRFSLAQDLNHPDIKTQINYQHGLHKQFDLLLEKAKAGNLVGRGLEWLNSLAGINLTGGNQSCFQPGNSILAHLDERWQQLIITSKSFLQSSRVFCGYCSLPQGPGACAEYLNCLECADGGCRWFFTDPNDETFLLEIDERVAGHECQYQESLESGYEVKASKIEVLLERAKKLQSMILEHTSPEILDRLRIRQQALREENLS